MSGTRLPNEFRGRPIRWKSLDRPDEVRQFPHGIGAFVDLDSLAIGRAVLEPGWRWSTDLKPMVGTEMCEVHHLHVLVSGHIAFQMADEEPHEFAPNDVMDIAPGHDAWVVGDQPVILLDISGNSADFGLPTSPARALATMLMTDIGGSTKMASELGDAVGKQHLAEHNRAVR